MSKKSLIFLLFVLVSGVAVLTWFVKNNGRGTITDPFSAIPSDACLVIESVDLNDFLGSVTLGNRLFGMLEKVKEAKDFCESVKTLRNIVGLKESSGIFEKNRTVISFHLTGQSRLAPLMSINLSMKSRFRKLTAILRSAGGEELEEIKKEGVNITPFIIKTGERRDSIFLAYRSGLALCSTSADLLLRAVLHSGEKENIRNAAGFTRIMAAAGRKDDKIYIVFRNFAEIIRSATASKKPFLWEKFAKLAGSAEADIHINENGIILSGYTEFSDSADILFRFKSGEPAKLTSYEILPSDVLLFETIRLKKDQADRAGAGRIPANTDSLAREIIPYLGDEITRAVLDEGSNSEEPSTVTIFKLANRQMAEEVLAEKCSELAERANITTENYIEYYQPDDQTRIPVYATPFGSLSSAFINDNEHAVNDSLFAFSDNYLVTGNSFAVIKRVLYDNILNKTLINDLSYRDFEATLPSRAGYYFYCQPGEIVRFLSSYVNDSLGQQLKSDIPFLRKIQAAGYQFASSNEMIYNTISLRFSDTTREASGAEWETMLDTSAAIKPFFFTNHNTGAREIFVQDYRNNVYLINSAGRVLWKVSPGEKILGNVYMIDYFNNGKYQLLFAGKNNLYLLDRNGNFVERFPARLRSPATGPPALFDYDGTGEFRILIPGEDRQIYAYDKAGNVVKGWKPFKTGGTVKSEIKFFRVSGKDYLVAADDKTIYFLDRTGNPRLRLRDPVVKAEKSEIRLDSRGYPGIVFTSPEGIITKVSFDGTVTKTAVGKFSVDHSFDFFDVTGDGFGEYVFIDKGILYLYGSNKSMLFKRDFGSANLEGPVFFIFSNSDRKIGVTDPSRKQIYLIDAQGNNVNGFPRKGASVFSIGKLSENGDYRLIVGGDDKFLYNYRVEAGN